METLIAGFLILSSDHRDTEAQISLAKLQFKHRCSAVSSA
jgi:hypothetical protein